MAWVPPSQFLSRSHWVCWAPLLPYTCRHLGPWAWEYRYSCLNEPEEQACAVYRKIVILWAMRRPQAPSLIPQQEEQLANNRVGACAKTNLRDKRSPLNSRCPLQQEPHPYSRKGIAAIKARLLPSEPQNVRSLLQRATRELEFRKAKSGHWRKGSINGRISEHTGWSGA